MLNVFVLSVVMLNTFMLNVALLSVVLLSVLGTKTSFLSSVKLISRLTIKKQ